MNYHAIFQGWFSNILINFLVTNWKAVNNIIVSVIKSANQVKGEPKRISLLEVLGTEVSVYWNGIYWEIEILGLISGTSSYSTSIYTIKERLTNGAWAYNSKVADRIKEKWKLNGYYGKGIKETVIETVCSRVWVSGLKDFTIFDRITGKEKGLLLIPTTPEHKEDEKVKDRVVDDYFTIKGTLRSSLFATYTGILFVSINTSSISGWLTGLFLGELQGTTLTPSETKAGSLAIDIKNALERALTK